MSPRKRKARNGKGELIEIVVEFLLDIITLPIKGIAHFFN